MCMQTKQIHIKFENSAGERKLVWTVIARAKMIAFLIFAALSISSISGHPAGADQDPACKTLQRFEKSLISSVTQKEEGPHCMDSQPKSKHFV